MVSAWTNLSTISISASSRDTGRWATDAQVGAVAGLLGKQIKEILANQSGLSVGSKALRSLRLRFLGDVLGNGPITTTKQLSFGEAGAVLDWLSDDSAADDVAAWLMEQELPYAEEMFGDNGV